MFALLPTETSSDDVSGFRHGFGPSIITTNPDFVGLSSLYEITISMLMQLEPNLGLFYVFPLV